MTVAVSYKSPKLAHCVLKSHLHVVRSRPVQTIKRSGVADCKIVSIATFAKVCFDQENKGCRAPTGKAPQYANPTIAHTSYHALNAPSRRLPLIQTGRARRRSGNAVDPAKSSLEACSQTRPTSRTFQHLPLESQDSSRPRSRD